MTIWRSAAYVVAYAVFVPLVATTQGGQEHAAKPLPPRATVDTDAGGPLTPELAAYDARFWALDVTVDPVARTIRGTVSVKARIVAATKRIRLDLDDRFTVASVERLGPGGTPRTTRFAHQGKILWVDLDPAASVGESLELKVAYSGSPRPAPNPPWEGGFTWATTADGMPWIGVSCQVDGSDIWWPSKDHPSDEPEDGVELRYTVPAGLEVVANGTLAGKRDNADGTRTWTWKVASPINLYGVTFNAAPFRKLEADVESLGGGRLPVAFFVLPEHVAQAQKLLPEMLDHIRFLELSFGPYPFRSEKLAYVEAPYLGMEHQTAITVGSAALGLERFGFHWVAFHELAHEWWGNRVSASDWRDFWLHEGFDGYSEALWVESRLGPEAYREYVTRNFWRAMTNERPVAPRESRSLRQVFYARPPTYTSVDVDAYVKGALVLHTLRYLLGDDSFFALLRRWANRGPAGSDTRIVTTEDFRALAEEISGRDLDWFFDVYLRQPHLPRLESSIELDGLRLQWRVPEGLRFPMPVEIESEGGRVRVPMPGGAAVLPWTGQARPEIDPDAWVLRDAPIDPDRFGTLGKGTVPIPYRQQEN